MNHKTFTKIFLPLVFLAFTLGCSTVSGWFGKKKDTDKPPEVLAAEGIKDLKKKNYEDAIETFEKVRDRYPYSEQALLAQLKVADAYFFKKKYEEAIQAYREFEKLHPTNKAVPYCIFREGQSYYRQRSTIDRDQTYTQKAIAEFKRLKQKFPDSEHIAKADQYLARCRKDLAEHEFYVAEFYFRTKRYQAAIDRYQALMQDYPDFPKNAEAKERIEECQRTLAAEKKPPGIFSGVANLFDARW
ncbi:MAG: outer membrane protein assembly factor BamD [Syntrophobacterales bacterium]|jgi:outer membrane protein assembly factor BamD|nr:outer membrane protein assembly factor BamD [Syntrophobacterales bacterium]